jgi:hypothetical protein
MRSAAKTAELLFSRAERDFARHKIREALAYYEKALELGLESDRGAFQRWTCCMLLGRFEQAWKETDRTEFLRRRLNLSQTHLPFHLRRVWKGESLTNGCVLVRCYHGLGDTIQFIRYIPCLAKIARRVIVQCGDELRELLGSVDGMDRIIPLGDSRPDVDFDVDIEVMELPYAFRTTLVDLPRQIPYVRVPSETTEPMAAWLSALEVSHRKPRVGLVWRGGAWNRQRSIPFAQVSELTKLQGVNFFSLQRGGEMEGVPFGSRRVHLIQAEDQQANLLRTAATIQNLDLLISVDTMAAHLAGALGKPVWALLPFVADWRWMIDRPDSPWYSSMRLFRQVRPGDWETVIERVAEELSRFSKKAARHGAVQTEGSRSEIQAYF